MTSDFGDAPDADVGTGTGNYQTSSADDGPSHDVTTTQTTLFLGARVDGEADAAPNSKANGDDIATLPDDEDGLIEPAQDLLLTVGTAAVVRVRATNSTGSTATLYGWIDFNRDGMFDNATERTSVTVPTATSNGTFTLTFPTIPKSTTVGTTYARFRLSTDAAAANSTGASADGEVEDYAATITLRGDSTADSAKTKKIAHQLNGGPTLANFDRFGVSVASLGDLDGDGVTDLAVGAYQDGTGGTSRGAVHVLLMNADGSVKSSRKIAHQLNGGPTLANSDLFGSSVASLSDLDGDGVTDLAVGASADDTGGASRGAVYVLLLNADGTVKSRMKIAHQLNGRPSLANSDRFGNSVASLGDLDGDGVADLAVGAYQVDTGGMYRGAVHVLLLNANGTVKSSAKIASGMNGGPSLANTDFFGKSVASLGDLDGDGVTDLAVGAFRDGTGGASRGAVHVLLLNSNGTVKSSTKIANGTNGGPTLADYDFFGSSVASLGDLDGDGVTDLAVGAYQDGTGGASRGAVHVLLLNSNGTVKSSTKIANGTNGGPTLADYDRFGASVVSLGDLDGDGVTDLAVGGFQVDTGGTSRGAVYVLLLKPLVNNAPTLANIIPDQTATEDAAYTFAFGADTFADEDAGDSLTYSATKSDGSALPSWLTFTAAARRFSGTPLNAHVGSVSIKVTAKDGRNAIAIDTFDIVVVNTNDVPTLTNAIPDRNATEESAFTFSFAANTFADVDVGDSLTYSATRSDGTGLPSWLTFRATTRTFSGTPLNSDVGTLSIKVTAMDTSSTTATDTFNIVVAKSPSAFNGGYTGTYRGSLTYPRSISLASLISNRSFTAMVTDGDVTGNLPATGGTATGTVNGEGYGEMSDSGPIFIPGAGVFDVTIVFSGRLVATASGVTGSGTIDISGDLIGTGTWTATRTSTTPNKAPVFEIPASPDQTVLEDAGVRIVNGFATGIADGDIDKIQTSKFLVTTNNDSLFLTKPAIDATTGTLTYTPAPNANGAATVTVKLKDNGGTARGGVDTSALKTFKITVIPVNDGPTITAIKDVTIDEDKATGAIAFKVDDPDDKPVNLNAVTVTATSSNTDLVPNLSANIVFGGSVGSRTIKLVPLANQFGTTTITVTATDSSGATTEETFVLTVRPINDAPRVVPATFQLPEFTANNASVGTVAAVDPEGHAITSFAITGGNAGNAFKIDSVTGEIKVNDASKIDFESLAKKVGNDLVATFTLTIKATDALGAAGTKADETGPITIIVDDQSFALTIPALDSDNTLTVSKVGNNLVARRSGVDLITPTPLEDVASLTITGGSAKDTVVLDASLNSAGTSATHRFTGQIVVNGNDGDDKLDTSKITVATLGMTFNGGTGNDTALGGSGNETLNGDDGNDSLSGGAGNDILNGGKGDDQLLGGTGNDIYLFVDTDIIETDMLTEIANAGTDVLDFSNLTIAVTAKLSSEIELAKHNNRTIKTSATGTTKLAPNFENVIGGAGDDQILGNAANNSLLGGAGRDTLIGGAGNDTLRGGNDDDTLIGGLGADSVFGDSGNDLGLGGRGSAARGGNGVKDTGDILDASIEAINDAFATPFAFE